MAKLYYDLHMHSCLSPCGDCLMTPNNIVNMAHLKGLDIISVTDHNNASNLPAIFKVAKETGITVIPGMEVTVKEEAHILCYFNNLNDCLDFSNFIYERLPNIKNNEKLFGEQIVMNSEDEEILRLDKLLISAADISISELAKKVLSMNAAIVPAHVDKKNNSIIESLGFIPFDLPVKTIEVSKNSNLQEINKKHFYGNYTYISSTDAHQLEDISEKLLFIETNDNSVNSIINYLRNGSK